MALIDLQGVCVEFDQVRRERQSIRQRILEKIPIGGTITHGRRSGARISALNNVSLHIEDGDRVALLGANGSGKTTLLRVLAGVYAPVRGRVRIDGRISTLFNASLGFDQEASGLENIILRGIVLGLSPDEIEGRVDEIADFSELGPYLSMPIRTYSSGMVLRLAFAVSTVIDPEILILDEWIGAGDAHFIEKAEKRMLELIDRSNILVVASHRLGLVKSICTRAVLLDHGTISASGSVEDIIRLYAGDKAVDSELLSGTDPLQIAQA